jgi:hypothetical protein
VLFAVVAVASAQIRNVAPLLAARSADANAYIVKDVYEPNPDGSYVYR